jgi:GNAT superfamily N-acetyltransferase
MPEPIETIIVRECRDSDRPLADRVTQQAFQTLRHIYRPSPEALLRKQSLPPAPRLIALAQSQTHLEKIVGSVEYEIARNELSLMALAVHPAWTRRGIARLLIRELIAIGTRAGAARLTLWTIVQTGNVPIFERLGFHTLKITPADLFESATDSTLTEAFMELPLFTAPVAPQ